MTNKFPIGSQWKTRAGHRAVVVDVYSDGSFMAYHKQTSNIFGHNKDGVYYKGEVNHEYDLLTPWLEPRKGTFWVNVYHCEKKNRTYAQCYRSIDEAIRIVEISNRCIVAAKEFNYEEGQGL